jgi:hypothetical protein
MWGHGLGWKGFAIDETAGIAGTSMTLAAFGEAVSGKGLQVIGFDTAFGVTLESVYEAREAAAYLAGTPGVMPGGGKGWDYRRLFASFAEKTEKTAETFCESVAEQYRNQYGDTAGACITVADLAKAGGLFSAFEEFSGALAETVTTKEERDFLYDSLLDGTVTLYHEEEYPADAYADLYSLSLQGEGGALREALEGAVKSWSEEYGTERALLGVFVNQLATSGTFAPSHETGYKRETGSAAFVRESATWVPAGNTGGPSFLDKMFYGEYD